MPLAVACRPLAFCALAICALSSVPSHAATPATGGDAALARCVAEHRLDSGDATIRLDFDASAFTLGAQPICDWAQKAALAVSAYFGRFPVHQVRIQLRAADGGGVHGGSTYGDGDEGHPLTTIGLGRAATQADLDRDWVMTHEMVHLAVPSVPRRSHWLEEGIATYVEPIARARLGQLDSQRVWADMLSGMPKGEPADGDRGLDHTPTWGRTYWGGALFCLAADVEIRKRSDGRKSLRDALRAVVAAGGNIESDWTVARFVAVADAGTGVPVLAERLAAMADAPERVDLAALWRQLGVEARGDGVRFDDSAPLAGVRRAITAP